MTTAQLIVIDHVTALVSAVTWFGAGAASAGGRVRAAAVTLAAAAVLTMARVATAGLLGAAGWWFVEEKVLLTLPLALSTGLVAVLTARRRTPPASASEAVVTRFTAGYAAVTGLAVSFLGGYPLTVTTSVVAVAAVAVAAMLTARAQPRARTDGASVVTRRTVLGAVGGAAALTAAGAVTGSALRPGGPEATADAASLSGGAHGGHGAHPAAGGGGAGPALSVADLRGAEAPAAGGVVQRHVITARRARVRLPSGRTVDAWTFDGSLPGPALEVRQGDLLDVTLRNRDIDEGVTLHWHGYDVACGEDGAPGLSQPVVLPGEEFRYHFRADQVGTYWFHTHRVSHVGVRKGLYGTLVVHPRHGGVAQWAGRTQGLDLTLPIHTLDRVLLVGAHDTVSDHMAQVGDPVRLRLLNTDSEPHRAALSGVAFRVVAVDGRDLNEPGETRERALTLPAGGRIDVTFTMPTSPVALVIDNDDEAGVRVSPSTAPTAPAAPAALARLHARGTSAWPELDLLGYGAPTPLPFDPTRPNRRFTVVLDRGLALVDGRPALGHTVNGKVHPAIPDQVVSQGDIVRFTVVNRSLDTHPWHLHGHPVLVLSRNGRRAQGSPLLLDTFDVRPGEVWEVAFRATNPGIWMNHCHNLPHADQGMMLRLAYVGVTSPFDDGHGGHE